jgi:hypothetical protein
MMVAAVLRHRGLVAAAVLAVAITTGINLL